MALGTNIFGQSFDEFANAVKAEASTAIAAATGTSAAAGGSQIRGQMTREATGAFSGIAGRQQANSANVRDSAYKALVSCSEQNIFVSAWLPETVGLDVNANYEAPYAQGIGALNDKFGALAQFVGMNLTTQALTAQIWQGGSFINFSIPFIFQAETNAETDVMKPIKDLLRLAMPKDPSGGGILEAPGPHIDIKKLALNAGGQAAKGVQDIFDFLGGTPISSIIDTAKQFKSDPLGQATRLKDAANNVSQRFSSALVNSVVNNISLQIGQFLYFPSVVVTDVSPTFDVVLNAQGKPMRATVNVTFRTFYIPTQNDIDWMFMNMTVEDNRGVDLGQFL